METGFQTTFLSNALIFTHLAGFFIRIDLRISSKEL
nr:MAG TPA: hypothetical protein [Caudoviricetes sp.]